MIVQGDRFTVEIGAPAHGGHCVARHEGMVVFVRHALPGEQAIVEVTELHKGFLRADAVEILQASKDRITPNCSYAHPDGCGGCDLQHVAAPAQLEWKAQIVQEQLARLAGLTWQVKVEALPGDGLGWRTRVKYHVDALGRPGLLKHRSNEVVQIDRCAIAHPSIQDMDVLSRTWDQDVIEVVNGELVEDQWIFERALGREFTLPAEGFWQVHPAAADTLAYAVLDMLKPQQGERAWDLYGGAGLFAAALAGCHVTLVEAADSGVEAARVNVPDVHIMASTVERAKLPGKVDIVVLDPPRTGAGARVVQKIIAANPRAVAYVACDPAALARDVRTFRDNGWDLAQLRAFDCFPQTHHVECVALLVKSL